MPFQRRKKVGYRFYWYLVENHRVDGRVRQKILEYLGPEVPIYGRFYKRGPWTPVGYPNLPPRKRPLRNPPPTVETLPRAPPTQPPPRIREAQAAAPPGAPPPLAP